MEYLTDGLMIFVKTDTAMINIVGLSLISIFSLENVLLEKNVCIRWSIFPLKRHSWKVYAIKPIAQPQAPTTNRNTLQHGYWS